MYSNNKNKAPLINRTFILFFLLSVSLLIFLGAYLYYKHELKQLYQDKSNDLEAIASLKISELVAWKKERTGDAKVLSQMPFVIDFIEGNDKNTDSIKFERIFGDILNLYDYEDIIISSNTGAIIYSAGYDHNLLDQQTKEKIRFAIQHDSILAADFYYSELRNSIHYDIIAPVHNRSDIPIAVMVFRIDPDNFLFPYIQSWPTPSLTAETLLIRKENDSVLFLNELRHIRNSAFSLKIPLTETDVPAVQAIMGYKGILQGIDYRGVEVVAYVSPVEGTNWYLVSKIDRSELLTDLRFKLGSIIIASVFVILFFGVGMAWLYSSRQKIIYKSLYETQEEFRTTLYSIGDAVITTDRNGKIKQLNKVAEELTGWPESDATGRPIEKIFNIINEETRKKLEGPVNKIIAEGKIVGLANHTILITKQGKEVPINDSGAPIKNSSGNIVGTVLVFRDQTEERKTSKLLSKRLNLLEYSAFHTMQEILQRTIDDVCELTNSKIGFYYTIEPDQKTLNLQVWSTKTLEEFYKTEEKDLHYTIDKAGVWTDCIRQRKPVIHNDYSTLEYKKGMTDIHAELIRELVVPVFKEDKIVAIIGVVNKEENYDEKDIDVTAYLADIAWEIAVRKKAEESLEEEQRMLTSLINTIPYNIYFKNTDCNFIRINDAMAKKLELNDAQEAAGKNDTDYFGPEHATQTYIDEKSIMKTGNPLVNFIEKEDWEDGKITWVSTTKIPLRDKNGKTEGIMGISRDITEQKRMEDELIAAKNKAEQSDMLKSAFLANMSHEIRTPLNGILGFTEILLKKNDMTQEEKDHYSSIITKSANGLLQVINDILDISLIEAGDIQIELKTFDLKKTLEELKTVYTEKIHGLQKNIKVELYSKNNLVLNFDENRLRQIFINLLNNAIKFTEEGQIEFGVEKISKDDIVYFVRDTGPGIPEDKHELIFDRFRQVDSSPTRKYGGNGLGLSIVKNMVELMHGKIWIESETNKGSTFRFSLPYDSESIISKESSKDEPVKQSEQLLNILLVEDDQISRFYMEELLEEKCKKLVTAINTKEAMLKIKSEKFDVILMDIRLPDGNGLDLVKDIRKFNEDVYIIAQTAYAMHSDKEKALLAGCNEYISKPINIDLLLETLRRIKTES